MNNYKIDELREYIENIYGKKPEKRHTKTKLCPFAGLWILIIFVSLSSCSCKFILSQIPRSEKMSILRSISKSFVYERAKRGNQADHLIFEKKYGRIPF